MRHNSKTKITGTQNTILQLKRWAPKRPSPSVDSSHMKVKVAGTPEMLAPPTVPFIAGKIMQL